MTQEDKNLLLLDLSGRLTYNVKCNINKHTYGYHCTGNYNLELIEPNKIEEPFRVGNYYGAVWLNHEEIKPYLYPLSSMTEEQKIEYCKLQDKFLRSSLYQVTNAYELFDWLNKNHFDYRNLIEKDLAIDATNVNIY